MYDGLISAQGIVTFYLGIIYQLSLQTTSQRLVKFVVTRTGGDLGNVAIGYEVQYLSPDGVDQTASTRMNISTTGSTTMMPGQRTVSIAFTIAQDAFIQANSVFTIRLTHANLTGQGKADTCSDKGCRFSIYISTYIILYF